MADYDKKGLKKKLKKKISKQTKKYGKFQINRNNGGGLYFLAFVGSAIYFISHSTGFWDGVLGFLKAIVWPAFLVYESFAKLLG